MHYESKYSYVPYILPAPPSLQKQNACSPYTLVGISPVVQSVQYLYHSRRCTYNISYVLYITAVVTPII